MTRKFRLLIGLGALVASLPLATGAAAVTFLGPTGPYLQLSDSPFASGSFAYFHVETLEDNALDTPGLGVSGAGILVPSAFTDSVDGDDGVFDGLGRDGHSWQGQNSSCCAPRTLILTFDENALPTLPTHVGLVFTNAVTPIDLTIEAFDGSGVSLGSVVHTGFNPPGSLITANARFFGAADLAGISRLEFTYNGINTTMEFDHFQYGSLNEPTVPALGGLGLAAAAGSMILAGAVVARRRAR